jgi:thiamine biosynthesis lipoprotein
MRRFRPHQEVSPVKKYLSALLTVVLHLTVCTAALAESYELVVRSRPMLHTLVEIKAWGPGAGQAIEEAFAEMERVNRLLNNYDPQSEVSAINRAAGDGPVRIGGETMEALTLAVQYGDITGGALDITIGPLLRLWGFGKDEVGLEGKDPDPASLAQARALVNYRALELSRHRSWKGTIRRSARLAAKGMWIDVGSFSKGYVADKAVAVLKRRHIENALVIAGGTVCGRGAKPDGSLWQVGVQHPRDPNRILTAVALNNCSISTSGDYENFYLKNGRRRGHIIDPRTGAPVSLMQSVSVIAPDGATSDLLDTPLFVLGPEQGMAVARRLKGIEVLMVAEGGQVVYTEGWPQKNITY